MPHRRSVPVALVLCLLSATGGVAQTLLPVPTQTRVSVPQDLPPGLAALFDGMAAHTRITMYPDGSASVPAAMVEVLVAKIGPDGKLVTACVNDKESARRFFGTPEQQPKQRTIMANDSREK